MIILFIADIHLCNKKPYITEIFLHFLYYQAINAQALYILGDLFEIWIGDDDPNPLHIKIARALKHLHKHHVSCYFIHGNHDFLLRNQYATNCGMTLLPIQKVLNLCRYRITILHGDTLCTKDNSYQTFRKYTRQTWLQNFFLSLPISTRLYISKMIQKNKKKKHTNNICNNIDQQTIIKILSQTNSDIIIHGHIHQSKMYYKIINNMKILERITLGTWKHTGSVLEFNKQGIHLIEFSLKNPTPKIIFTYKHQCK